MSRLAGEIGRHSAHPVDVHVAPALEGRNRLTAAFRIFLAIPHLMLVGGPLAAWAGWMGAPRQGGGAEWGGGGVLGAVAAVAALIGWFAILATGRYPEGLYRFAVGVLRWNTRVEAYLLLLHDEYPPFALE